MWFYFISQKAKLSISQFHQKLFHINKVDISLKSIRDIHLGYDVMNELKEARLQYMNDALEYGAGFQNLGFV